ncbi:MAG: BON domain-containing protein [Proteobacteria bacterium]|nr:BON domain-containing protein [Pseudomonadota bacterium]
MPRPIAAGLLGVLVALPSLADEERRNWFDDPFFRITSAVAHCPEPLGPRTTEAERRVEAHGRAERGTTCWLAGKCSKPNAYLYDADIATAIRARVAADHPFAGSSLWVTVQRRFVFVEGCVARPADERAIEAYMQAVPDVDRVLVNVYADPQEKPPYKAVGG